MTGLTGHAQTVLQCILVFDWLNFLFGHRTTFSHMSSTQKETSTQTSPFNSNQFDLSFGQKWVVTMYMKGRGPWDKLQSPNYVLT